MFVTSIYYYFCNGRIEISKPLKIEKETKCFYITDRGNYHYRKDDIGIPKLMSPTNYTYIQLHMIDADENTLRQRLSEWFTEKAEAIKKGE